MQNEHPDREVTSTASDTASSDTASDDRARPGRVLSFASEHPLLAILGVAGIGLVGGVELAAGVLIGAGAAAALRARTPGPDGGVRRRARTLVERAPRKLRERARAVFQAALGELPPREGQAAPERAP